MRKALELAAGLEGSTTASYATQLLTQAIKCEIKDDPVLFNKWIELEKEAISNESWDKINLPISITPEDIQDSQPNQKGWFLAGDNPEAYIVGKDKSIKYKGISSGFIRSKLPKVTGFGTLMQQTDIKAYVGKKIELTGVIKAKDVKQ